MLPEDRCRTGLSRIEILYELNLCLKSLHARKERMKERKKRNVLSLFASDKCSWEQQSMKGKDEAGITEAGSVGRSTVTVASPPNPSTCPLGWWPPRLATIAMAAPVKMKVQREAACNQQQGKKLLSGE